MKTSPGTGLLLRLGIGALAGMSATGPMTLVMTAIRRRLPAGERYPLPPREIVSRLGDAAGAPEPPAEVHTALTLTGHFAYGAAMGSAYAALAPAFRRPGSPVVGALHGLAVWLVSYLGFLPAVGVLRPATEHPARRNALMIVAHLAWGGLLALLVAALCEEAEGARSTTARSRRRDA